MTTESQGSRLAAILWFVAATLAFIATGLSLADGEDVKWSTAAGGTFCLAMGLGALRRKNTPRQ